MCAIFEAWKGKIWTDPRFKGKKMGQNGVKMGQNESISGKKKKKGTLGEFNMIGAGISLIN